uniref:4a-hydroxytetrahydrobiopterin dehydratase n=4 Tax=Aegilops tauschii subsp. strangulata TaxID=200361 RepID=A0A453PYL1_AEGTS
MAWKVKNFVKGLEFFQLVAAVAEEEGHHPDLHLVGRNNVKIDVWTHSVSKCSTVPYGYFEFRFHSRISRITSVDFREKRSSINIVDH